jgi:cytoskeleton protein RodZ
LLESSGMEYTGSQLKKIRLERNIPLVQVASATRIRMAILQDLEDEEYSELSSTTQAKGFLRLYAQFLGLPDRPEVQDTQGSVETTQSTELTDTRSASETPEAPSPEVVTRVVHPDPLPKESSEQPFTATETTDPTPEIVVSESQKHLQAIGRELVARRRYLNVSWDLIEQETHIPREQLRNVERGDLDAFFNPTKYKSVLLSYTQFLNLDTTAIMIRYADAMQKRRLEKNVTKKRRLQGVKVLPASLVNLKRFFTLDLFFGTLMILGIVGFLVWGISRMSFGDDSPDITATLPAVADILLAEITPEAFEVIETPEPTQELLEVPTPTPFFTSSEQSSALELVILIRQNTWLRVISDGEIVYQGRQAPGNVLTYAADESIELQTGNIAGLEIIFNQNPYDNGVQKIGTAARLWFSDEGVSELPIIDSETTEEP